MGRSSHWVLNRDFSRFNYDDDDNDDGDGMQEVLLKFSIKSIKVW